MYKALVYTLVNGNI